MSKFKLDTSREEYICTITTSSGKTAKCYALNPEKLPAAKERLMKALMKDAGILINEPDI